MSLSYNKIIVNKKVLIDLTSDTVTSDTLLSGRIAHSSDGSVIVGNYELPSFNVSDTLKDSDGNDILDSSGISISADTGYVSLADHYKEVEGLKSIIRQYQEVINNANLATEGHLLDSNYQPIEVTPIRF